MENSVGTKVRQSQRVVRVFISSTFRDMHEERDYLATHVFPDLRDRCRKRRVEFVEVDLRWGITEEQANRGEVLPICLSEIENCRPYFIGLLGERYGWVPDSINPELLSVQRWLEEHKDKSVTELEILHGVLNNRSMADRSFFYFRDPGYIQTVPAERQADFLPEDSLPNAKLEKLKAQIRKSGLPVIENYATPQAVGELIKTDLWNAIDEEFPEEAVPDPLDLEAEEHEAFARSRAKIYIAREECYERLDEYVAVESGAPLCLVGESGAGKSALLANWVFRYREVHPEAFLLVHFTGSSPGSTDYVAIIRRVMGEIKRTYNLLDEIPESPDDIREAFPAWLAVASAKGGVVLVLDALDQLENRDNAPQLGWLPNYILPKIHLIVSALPGAALNEINKRDWSKLEVTGLNEYEVRRIITDYLARYRKALTSAQQDRIVAAPQTKNPLYLRSLLEELRVFGAYEELDSQIDHYLEANTVPDLYDRILVRLEQTYEKDRPRLVRDAMSLLWASRRGLYENELLELLGSQQPIPQRISSVLSRHRSSKLKAAPLPRLVWTRLYLAMTESLVSRSGLLGFFHDYLRKAVENRYLDTLRARNDRHIQLADYFEPRQADERKVDELPWQLAQIKEWKRLKDCLTEIPLFLLLNEERKRHELTRYWLALPSRYDMADSYFEAVREIGNLHLSAEELVSALNSVASFLNCNSRYAGAKLLYEQALEIARKRLGAEVHWTAISMGNLALVLCSQGDYDRAELLTRKALTISDKLFGPKHPKTAPFINNLAELLRNKGDYHKAEPLARRALEIMEMEFGMEHPNTVAVRNNLGLLLLTMGDYDGAEPLYRRGVEIRQKLLGMEHPDTATSLASLAALLQAKGDYDDAEPLALLAVKISEKTLGVEHPNTAAMLNILATLLRAKGDYDDAELLLRRVIEIFNKNLGFDHPNSAQGLNNLATLLADRGDYNNAEPLCRRALWIREKTVGPRHPDTAESLSNLATLLQFKGDYDGAEPLARRALEIQEESLGAEHSITARSLSNLGYLLEKKCDYDAAEPLYRRAQAIREKALGPEHPDSAMDLINLGRLLEARGDFEAAEPLYRHGLKICEKALGDHPRTATVLETLAGLLCSKRDYGNAEQLCRRILVMREKILGPKHPATVKSLNDLAVILGALGNYAEAELVLQRMLKTKEEILGPENAEIADILNRLGLVLRSKGDFEAAEPMFRRALEINEKVLGPEHLDVANGLDSLASLLYDQSHYGGAELLYRRALKIKEKVLGLEHPETATYLYSLAKVLYKRGDYVGAEPLYRRALEIDEKVLGPEHLDVATDLNSLALLLYDKSDYEESALLFRRALEIWEKTLGPEHPYIDTGLWNLASALHNRGDYAIAESLYRRLIEIREKVLGSEHPNTKAVVRNLAELLRVRRDEAGLAVLRKRFPGALSRYF